VYLDVDSLARLKRYRKRVGASNLSAAAREAFLDATNYHRLLARLSDRQKQNLKIKV